MTQDRVESSLPMDVSDAESMGNVSDTAEAANSYDFDRLERSVGYLMREHQRLTGEREALLEELVERERRITSLEAKLAGERKRRVGAVEGVDKILGRLEQLQASVAAVVEPA